MPRPKFKKGNKLAKGGARPNTGPRPNWLKEKCAELFEKHDLLKFMVDVATGKDVTFHVTELGVRVPVPAGIKDRREAVNFIADRGFGKAIQGVEVSGEGGGPVKWEINIVPVQNA